MFKKADDTNCESNYYSLLCGRQMYECGEGGLVDACEVKMLFSCLTYNDIYDRKIIWNIIIDLALVTQETEIVKSITHV